MGEFDEEVNSTFSHVWTSREGDPDHDIYFPSSTFGIDANRTFDVSFIVNSSEYIPKWVSSVSRKIPPIRLLIDSRLHN